MIFSVILCFTPHFQQFEKIEMTKDIYMYYIKLARLIYVKKNMSHRFDKFMGRLHFFQLFSFDNVLFFTSKKGQGTEQGAKDFLKLVSKIEQAAQKENHCRSKNEVQ